VAFLFDVKENSVLHLALFSHKSIHSKEAVPPVILSAIGWRGCLAWPSSLLGS